MKTFKLYGAGLLVMLLAFSACTKDLDRFPVNDLTSEKVYKDFNGYVQAAAKVYGSFALTGSFGPGSSDLAGIDAGTSDFLRLWWKAQTLSTDEGIVAWNDPGIQDFHAMNWSASNPMLIGLYNRSVYQISVANEFLRESTADKLAARGITGENVAKVNFFRAEMRFLRAFQYWVLMDLYANPPFITEESEVGSTAPPQILRKDIFAYVEKELLAIEPSLANARTNEYGRADKAAAWALLSRLYLNAHIYNGGTVRYTDCITYSKKVIDAGYSLVTNYSNLFKADNHLNTSENIFTILYDGLRTQNYGGTTFLIHGSLGDNQAGSDFGVNGGWSGIRTTKNLVNLFPDPSGLTDKRAMFKQNNLEIDNVSNFKDGWAITKFTNVKSTGGAGSDPTGTFVDTDFPLFRLAEMNLNYAEAVLRGGTGGSGTLALQYVNDLRKRAHGSTSENFAAITLDDVLNEKGREMYWEGLRRTDLIRFSRFTEGTYLWPWKGNVRNGTGVPAFRALYPLPATDVVANPNLKQNPNY